MTMLKRAKQTQTHTYRPLKLASKPAIFSFPLCFEWKLGFLPSINQ